MDPGLSSSQSHPFLTSVVDGVLLPKMPKKLLAEKQLNSVPYIVGINQQEFGWIIPMVSLRGPLRLTSVPWPSASHLWSQDLFLLQTQLWVQDSCFLCTS